MLRKKILSIVLVLFFLPCIVYAQMPDLKLPLEAGQSYRLNIGYDGYGCPIAGCTPGVVCDSYHTGNHRYALDFDNPDGTDNDNPNIDILAAADGTVAVNGWDPDGYGNYLYIDHSDGYRTIYGHMKDPSSLSVGTAVRQGQFLGKMGTTGSSTGTHLHFELQQNGVSAKPEPMSGYTDFTVCEYYTSDNYGCSLTLNFTDDPVLAASTKVKEVHINELRTYINQLRVCVGLGNYSFTDTLQTGQTKVKAIHVQELRNALNDVYDRAGRTRPNYTDSTLTAGQTKVKAAHINELRDAVRAVE